MTDENKEEYDINKEHHPSADANQLDPSKKYCQSCIERGFKPPNPATREWQSGQFYCEECFDALVSNMTMIPKHSVEEVKHKLNGKSPVLDAIYEIYQVPESLRFDRVDTVCRNYEKLFNFRAPAIVNRSLEDLTIELEAMKSSIFYIQYFGEPLEIEIKRLKEEKRKEKNLSGVKDTAEAYVKDKKKSKVTQDKSEKLAGSLGLSKEQMDAVVKQMREKEFKKVTGVCAKCGLSHKEDDCPPGAVPIKEGVKPTQPIPSGGTVVNEFEKRKQELLAKARAIQGKT